LLLARGSQRRPSPKLGRDREQHRVQLEPVGHRLQLELVGRRLQLELVEGQIGAVDGLLRFRTRVGSAIVYRGTAFIEARHDMEAARLVRAA